MSNRTVNTNQLTPGTTFMVQGKVGFSRIASRIEGEELQQDMRRRQSKGWPPTEKPYTTMTINQANVLVKNPQQPSPEEQYAIESLYTSSSQRGQGGYSFTGNNKGTRGLPYVAVRRPDNPNVVDQIQPEGELANGLDVTLVMRVFKGKPNNGISLDGIIVNEPIRYFDNARAGAGLGAFGITFNPLTPGTLPTPEAGTDDSMPAYAEHEENPFMAGPTAANQGAPMTGANGGYAGTPDGNAMDNAMAAAAAASAAPAMTPNTGAAPVHPYGNGQQGIRYNPADQGGQNRGY